MPSIIFRIIWNFVGFSSSLIIFGNVLNNEGPILGGSLAVSSSLCGVCILYVVVAYVVIIILKFLIGRPRLYDFKVKSEISTI